MSTRLLVASIALALRDLGPRALAAIRGEGAPDVVGFLEPAFVVAPDEPVVAAGVDAFTFLGHGVSLLDPP
jgi:hypothetical protein